MNSVEPALYGLTSSNTNRSGEQLWGKNQFNSTFPVSLCLKMRDDAVRPVYVTLSSKCEFRCSDKKLSMATVVGRKKDNPFYAFEASFPPYENYVKGALKKIDLVVHHKKNKRPYRALEVKLTVVPDSTTASQRSSCWAPELVVRPVSSAYAMLNVAHKLLNGSNQQLVERVRDELEAIYSPIRTWNATSEILKHRNQFKRFSKVLDLLCTIQQPYLIQPIWRTQGTSFEFDVHCFDVFVWSDVSIMALPLDRFIKQGGDRSVSRPFREVVRHVRALYDLCTKGHFIYDDCYGGMGLDHQTDKAFSVSGIMTRKYLRHPRLERPHYSKEITRELILHGGEKMLKPERRLDMAVVVDGILGALDS